MPDRQVITPENLSDDFTVDLDREDGPLGLNLHTDYFERDEEGRIKHIPPALPTLGALDDTDLTGASAGEVLTFDAGG